MGDERAYNLVEYLRRCQPEDRHDTAIAIAQTRSEEGFSELVRMVEGRQRRILRWYDYSDQLTGIEAMGESAMAQAYQYLKDLYTSKRITKHVSTKPENTAFLGEPNHWKIDEKVIVVYPRARGKLSFELDHTYKNTFVYDNPAAAAAGLNKTHNVAEHIPNNKAHNTIISALEKLEKRLCQD